MGNTEIHYESVGVGLLIFFALMGIFTLPPLNVTLINMILVSIDRYIIPTLDQIDSFGDSMPLSPLEQDHQEIVLASMASLESHEAFSMNLDTYVPSPWFGSWDYSDPLSEIYPLNESIIEVMSMDETPWNDLHHHYSFLPSLSEMPSCLEVFISHSLMHPLQTTILVHEVLEGNMGNITTTIPIDISVQPEIIKIFQLGAPFPHHAINFFLPPLMIFSPESPLFAHFCNGFSSYNS